MLPIAASMEFGWYILGEEVEAFEQEFATYLGVKHCISVGNGLEALHLILSAYGIGSGADVIVPANTYIATWLAVSYAGTTLVPVEPLERTYNIDPAESRMRLPLAPGPLLPCTFMGRRLTWTQSTKSPSVMASR